jgi:hypothetical protein
VDTAGNRLSIKYLKTHWIERELVKKFTGCMYLLFEGKKGIKRDILKRAIAWLGTVRG